MLLTPAADGRDCCGLTSIETRGQKRSNCLDLSVRLLPFMHEGEVIVYTVSTTDPNY